MGKLGGREMTAGSDLDLILLYDHDAEADGVRRRQAAARRSQYYTRLTQRLIAAFSAPTAEGMLYEVDMRLRPSGNKGPVATQHRAFSNYQRQRGLDLGAHGADPRPRRSPATPALCAEVEAEIARCLASRATAAKIAGRACARCAR